MKISIYFNKLINAINKCCSFLQVCLQNTKLLFKSKFYIELNKLVIFTRQNTIHRIFKHGALVMTEHRFEQNQPLSISDTETKWSQYFNRQPLYAILSKIIHIVLQFNQRYLLVLHDTNLSGKNNKLLKRFCKLYYYYWPPFMLPLYVSVSLTMRYCMDI